MAYQGNETGGQVTAADAGMVERYRRDGFTLGPKLLSGLQCERLCEEVERVIRDRDRKDIPQPISCNNLSGNDATPVWQIVNIHRASEPFMWLLHTPAFVDAAAALTAAKELRLFHDQVQYKPKSVGGATPWHQDSLYWPPLTPKDEQITAWVALDDADVDNGCMSMVPGSHRWGDQIRFLHSLAKTFDADGFQKVFPAEFNGDPVKPVYAPVKRGYVHFHHPLCWHGSHENRSGRPRRALAIHLMNERTLNSGENGGHPLSPFVKVPKSAKVEGDAFPLLWPSA